MSIYKKIIWCLVWFFFLIQFVVHMFYFMWPNDKMQKLISREEVSQINLEGVEGKFIIALMRFADASNAYCILNISFSLVICILLIFVLIKRKDKATNNHSTT